MKKLYQDVIWMLVKAGASQAQVAEWSGMKRPNVSRLLREACALVTQ
jgi:DNA-binding transcriptional regulator LsrR (DeoR family)